AFTLSGGIVTSSEASPGSARVFFTRMSGIGDPNLIGLGMGAGSTEQTAPCSVLPAVMRPEGLEPPRVAPPAPKAGASANSATVANFLQMYSFPSPDVVPYSRTESFMFRPLVNSLLVVSALSAAVAEIGSAQNADKQQICSQIENRPFTVGNWATYNWTAGQTSASTLRMAVVGKEAHEGTTYYWYEVTIDDPQRPNAKMILQTLVPSLGSKAGVRAVIMKSGDQPAMKMPPQMVQMINSTPGTNITAEIARDCQEMAVVGWARITVAA